MLRISLLFLFSVLFSSLVIIGSSIVYGQTEEKIFESSQFSIKMNYPLDWTLIEDEKDFSPGTYDGTVYGRGAPGHAKVAEFCPSSEAKPDISECEDSPVSVGISIYRLADSMSPEQFAKNEISLLDKSLVPITKMKTLDSQATELSGLPAYQVVDRLVVFSKEASKSTDIYTVNLYTGYRVFFSADDEKYYDTYLPTFENMVSSFEISGVRNVQNEMGSAISNSSNTTNNNNVSVSDRLRTTMKGTWTNYTNDIVGVSFDYPSKWELEEKENRFETGPELEVYEGTYRFFLLMFNKKQNDMLDSHGLLETTKVIEDVTSEKEDYTIIESTDMAKYKIDGKRTGTFLSKSDGELSDVAQQLFVVENKAKGYIFGFEDSTLTFDDTETQEIMNRILESVKFAN